MHGGCTEKAQREKDWASMCGPLAKVVGSKAQDEWSKEEGSRCEAQGGTKILPFNVPTLKTDSTGGCSDGRSTCGDSKPWRCRG